MHTVTSGAEIGGSDTVIFWAHGWGRDHSSMARLAQAFPRAANILIDLPGFGASPKPDTDWDTAAYGAACLALIRATAQPDQRVVWVGHSFGARVGLRIADADPTALRALCLVAGAGLQPRRSLAKRARIMARRTIYRGAAKALRALGRDLEPLRRRFGSADYANAGPMRAILVKTVSEDLTEVARRCQARTLLLYGENDVDTPPEIGRRYAALIPNATLKIISGRDHHDILENGAAIASKHIARFLEGEAAEPGGA